ncbi:MAG: ABC transporter permease [Nocardioidaceae bacterium]
MLGYIIRRLVGAILVIFVTSVAVFTLFTYGPKDPSQAICPAPRCTAQTQAAIKKSLGLDQPLPTQYMQFASGVFTGRSIDRGAARIPCSAPCLGYSFIINQPVWQYLIARFPATVSIAVGGSIIYLCVGVLIGVLAARRRGTLFDRASVGATLTVSSIPYYVVALLAWLLLVNSWGIFPNSAYNPILQNPIKWASGLILVWLVLGLTNSTSYARYSRGAMVEALTEDFVRTAKAKGLRERRVVFKHALRAALAPVITIFGLDFATLLAGTVFTEQIFNIPGIGLAGLQAIYRGDLPIVLGTVLIGAVAIVLANLVVDVGYSLIDPRVRLS